MPKSNSDYRIKDSNSNLQLTNAIVLNDLLATISMPNKNSVFSGCTLEEGVGVTGQTQNPYSPSVWYPNCHYVANPMPPCDDSAGDTVLRSSLAEAEAFTLPPGVTASGAAGAAAGSTGITITNGHATVRDVTVLGFGTCYAATGAPAPIIDHLNGDCSAGIGFQTADIPFVNGFNINALLTSAEVAFNVSAIDKAAGGWSVTLDTGSNDIANGDVIWIAPQPHKGAGSAAGYWIVSGLATSPCMGPCTFTLTGGVSADLTMTGSTSSVPVNGTPAAAITGLDTNPGSNPNLKFIAAGQTVTDSTHTTCFPTGTFVTGVWPARGIVYVSAPATCTSSGDSFVFHTNDYAPTDTCAAMPSGAPPPDSPSNCAILDSNFRWGDGLRAENSGGMSVVNCHVFEHLVSFHMYDGVKSALLNNCATGNANDLPDRNLAALTAPASASSPSGNIISVLIDGSHTDPNGEEDACQTDWTNMVLGQHRQTNVVIQSDCDAPNRFANVSLGAGVGGIDLEVDAGGASLVNAEGQGQSVIFKAEEATLYSYSDGTFSPHEHEPANLNISNNRLLGVGLFLENNNAAATTTGCGNTFAIFTAYQCTAVLGAANGQVQFSEVNTAQVSLCPYGGNGLVMNGVLTPIPISCTFLNSSATTGSSTLNYIYAGNYLQSVIAVASNGAPTPKFRLTLGSVAGLSNGDTVTVFNVEGAGQANGTWTVSNLNPGTNQFDINKNYSAGYTGGGSVSYIGLQASAIGHAKANGIEVSSVDSSQTLVGLVFTDSGQLFQDTSTRRDVASWYNRRIKTCVQSGLSSAGTTSTVYSELDSTRRCEFVAWGDSGLPWSLGLRASNTTASDGVAASAGFDVIVPPPPQVEEASAKNGAPFSIGSTPPKLPLTVSGSASLSEGKHFITALGKALGGGTATFDTESSYLEVKLPQ